MDDSQSYLRIKKMLTIKIKSAHSDDDDDDDDDDSDNDDSGGGNNDRNGRGECKK